MYKTLINFPGSIILTEDVVKVGDIVTAKCIGVDDKGKVKMSRKAAMKEKDEAAQAEAAPQA